MNRWPRSPPGQLAVGAPAVTANDVACAEEAIDRLRAGVRHACSSAAELLQRGQALLVSGRTGVGATLVEQGRLRAQAARELEQRLERELALAEEVRAALWGRRGRR